MATPFSRSLRSLAQDSASRAAAGILVSAIFLAGWLAWLLLAEVPIYKASSSAQLADQAGAPGLIAAFSAADALGHLRPGQPAWVELEGFPSVQYGKLPATVTAVGSQIESGQVRVELLIDPEQRLGLPLHSGMPASVEVLVDQASPATLLLRAVGGALSSS